MQHRNHQYHHHHAGSAAAAPYRVVKCTEVPQFDALQTAADDFRYDDKLHLRNLCNDSARCQGLTAVHLSTTGGGVGIGGIGGGGGGIHRFNRSGSDIDNNDTTTATTTTATTASSYVSPVRSRQLILDYSRQQVTGETMELLFDLADAVGLTERREAMRSGAHINVSQNRPVLHHLLRMPEGYPCGILPELFSSATSGGGGSTSSYGAGSGGGGGGGGDDYYQQPRRGSGGYGRRNSPGKSYQNQSVGGGAAASYSPTSNGGDPTTNTPTTTTPSTTPTTMLDEILQVRRQIADFARQVRSGDYRGVTGQVLTDTIVVSASGGMHLGTKALHTALSVDGPASQRADGRRLHFLSNIDPVDTYLTTQGVDPAKTLVVVVSKDFKNSNELINLRSVRNWLCQHLTTHEAATAMSDSTDDKDEENNENDNGPPRITETEIIERHVVAVMSANSKYAPINYAQMMSLPKDHDGAKCRIFFIWDWIIGRFSVCSAVGALPLSLQYSFDVVADVLAGAHNMDEHFFHAPLRDNIPVLLGLLGVWNSTFMGYTTRALLPYSEALVDFPAYVQLVDMESNGKRVAIDGDELLCPAGEIDFGDSGGNAQRFHQMMHQGRVIPVDFIGFMESPRPIQLPGEALSSHDEFMSNFFAQPDALAYGKTLVDLMQEGVSDGLREHMVFTGNRPSSSILMTRLDPFSIGQLVALYEHRTAVQGFVWGINSFDQFGLELGKLLSRHIRVQLAASRAGATVQGFNQSTSSLLEAYISHRKQSK